MTYLIKNKYLLAYLGFIDAMVRMLPPRSTRAPQKIKKILLANCAHIGDILISSGILPLIKRHYPDAAIGFIGGSWAQHLLKDNPHITYVYVLDHWFFNKSSQPLILKILRYLCQKRQLLKQLTACNYDVAIDFNAYFYSGLPLFWQLRIPIRVAYASAGLQALATQALAMPTDSTWCEARHQAQLLAAINIKTDAETVYRPMIYYDEALVAKELENFFIVRPTVYIVIHVGSRNPSRELPLETWRDLLNQFIFGQFQFVFTGNSLREMHIIQSIILDRTDCINCCQKISFYAFADLIKRSALLFSVETVAGHIAAAFQAPCVSVYTHSTDIQRWAPQNAKGRLLLNSSFESVSGKKLHALGEQLMKAQS